jgi:hypothetical protein
LKLEDSLINYQGAAIFDAYLRKKSRKKPEFLLTDYDFGVNSNRNFEQVDSFFKERFGLDFPSLNSGVAILYLGYYIAYKNGCKLDVYGLDMGEGGKVYFDGTTNMNHCVYRDTVKEHVKKVLDTFYASDLVEILNHSNFLTKLN